MSNSLVSVAGLPVAGAPARSDALVANATGDSAGIVTCAVPITDYFAMLERGDIVSALGYTPGSSNGTVGAVVVGAGLTGGTITTAGTVALASIAASSLMGNPGTSSGVPASVSIGAGIALSEGGTLSNAGVTIFNNRAGVVTMVSSDVSGALGFTPLDAGQVGTPFGVAALDGHGMLSASQIPAGLAMGLKPTFAWDATANSPSLAPNGGGTANAGVAFFVGVAGTTTLDGISVWDVQDIGFSNGTAWQRVPATGLYGSMALQSSESVVITGGVASSLSSLGIVGGYSVGPLVSYYPGYAKVFVGSDGVTAFGAIDITGKWLLGSAQVTDLGAAALTATSATVAGVSTNITASLMGMQWMKTDSTGTKAWLAYDNNDTFHMNGLAVGTLTVGGQVVTSTSTAPSDALDVRGSAFGALGDGIENIGYATVSTTNLSDDTITLTNFTGTLSLVQSTGTTALLTIVGVVNSGWAFQPYHAGKSLYLVVGSYTLAAKVAQYIDGQNVVLTASGVTPQSSASGSLTCPAFTSDRVGKSIVVDGMGQGAWSAGFTGGYTPDTVTPYGTQFFVATISTVAAGNQVTINASFPFAWSGMPAHLRWGTNDAAAVAQAAQTAFAGQKRKIYFSGDGALYLLLGVCAGSRGKSSYLSQSSVDCGALINGVIWEGDNSKAFVTDAGGLVIHRGVSQRGSDATRSPDRMLFGRGTFRRCSQLNTINVFLSGDSQCGYNPQGQAAGWMQAHKFVEQFRRANPGKTINIYELGVGASTWTWLADPAYLVADSSHDPVDAWTVPRPISGTVPYINFLKNANQTGSGAAILPDLVVFLENGGNDALNIDVAAMWTLINTVRGVSHGDAFGPADVVLHTDHQFVVISTTASGNTGGANQPGPALNAIMQEYATGIHRSTAVTNGWGCIDAMPIIDRAAWGIDTRRMAMRNVPSVTVTPTLSAPFVLPIATRDYTFWFSMPGASDAAVWSAIGELDFALSMNPGNKAMMRLGPNGNIWLGVSTFGGTVTTTCSIASSGTSLTVGAATTTLSGATYTAKTDWTQIGVSGTPFTSGMVGKCIITPTGFLRAGTYQPQRNFIQGLLDTSDVLLSDPAFYGTDINGATGNITIGGAQFIPQDGTSQPDVVIFYPDGTIWNTQVAAGGYVSATQATLATAAPEALTAQAVPVFIGRMGVKWYDTGINMSGVTSTGTWEIDINRESLLLGYQPFGAVKPSPKIDIFVERFGGAFFPRVTPGASQQIVFNDMWIDTAKPFMPSVTPWEVRGIRDANADYFMGGVGGHPSSRLRTDVYDPLYAYEELSTY